MVFACIMCVLVLFINLSYDGLECFMLSRNQFMECSLPFIGRFGAHGRSTSI